MQQLATALIAITLAVGFAACGSDDEGGESGGESEGEDFTSQADAICTEAAGGIRDVNLELGYATEEDDLIERLEQILEVRATAASELEALEPPADSADAFEEYVAARQDLVETTEAEIAAREDGDAAAIEKAAAEGVKAAEAIEPAGKDAGLEACAGVLPDDDAQAAEDVLREYATTADPETSCDPDELVTEVLVEEGFGGADACAKEQEKARGSLAEDITVDKVTGVDDIVATLEYEDVGGEFDGLPTTGQLYYVDGGWKVFSIAETN